MSKYDVYGIGNALVDFEFAVTEGQLKELSVDKGLMTLVDEKRQGELLEGLHRKEKPQRACGGSAANSMIAVSQLGGNSFYTCKVAKDETGDFYFQDLQKNQVDSSLSYVAREEGVTGKCFVMVTPDAERSMCTFLGITETLSDRDLVELQLKESQYLYMEGYTVTSSTGRAAAITGKELADRYGVKTAITFSDPNMVNFFRDGLVEMMGSGVNLLFCNEAEALAFAKVEKIEDAVPALLKVTENAVVTLGARGALVCEEGKEPCIVEAYPCKPVDTNGAGDIFAGSFLYGLTHGLGYIKSAKLANYAASLLVQKYSPRLDSEGVAELNKFKDSL